MKQICYLHSEANATTFQTLFEELDIMPLEYAIATIPSLTAFAQREKTLSTQDYICIDLTSTQYSNSHVLSAVQYIRRYSQAELIFLAEKGEETTQLYGSLAEQFHVKHLIKNGGQAEVIEKMRACLQGDNSPLGFVEDIVAKAVGDMKKAVKLLEIPEGLVISVGCAGSQARCGTTTQVIMAVHALNAMGFRVAVMDRNKQFVDKLWRFCPAEERETQDGVSKMYGVYFVESETPEFNAYVHDCGIVSETDPKDFVTHDLNILVCCTKPWELPFTLPAIRLAHQWKPQNMMIVTSFSTKEESEEVQAIVGQVFRANYRPDIWSKEIDATYKQTLLPILRRICGDGE